MQLSLFFLSLLPLASATIQIVSGGSWTTTQGEHIQAHGGSIVNHNGAFYLIGENKFNGSPFQSIRCYKSSDLVNWSFEGTLLQKGNNGNSANGAGTDLGESRVVERPKVIYNDQTRKWVMYLHIDSSNYGEAKVGVAVSDSICGQYQYRGSFRPLDFESRDMGLYKDTDGKGYLLTEDRKNGLRINRLSDDYLSVVSNVYTWKEKYESPTIAKKDGVYYMFASQLTGWDTNDNKVSTATSLSGPWSSWANFAPSGSKTHNSQCTYVLQVGNFYMYMGDRWVPNNLMSSTYVWLPLTLDSGSRKATLPWYYNWIPSVSASSNSGNWAVAPSDNSYEAEASSSELSSSTKVISCSDCSGGKAIGYVGGPSNGYVQINNIQSNVSGRTTIRCRYLNGDNSTRYLNVSVNGGQTQKIAVIPSADGNTTGVFSFTANLNAGNGNRIRFEGVNGGWGPDLDRCLVPTQ